MAIPGRVRRGHPRSRFRGQGCGRRTDAECSPAGVPTLAATVVGFVLGYVVIIGFLKFVSTFSYKAFAIYRIALGRCRRLCC